VNKELELITEIRDQFIAIHRNFINQAPENIGLSTYRMIKLEKLCMQPFMVIVNEKSGTIQSSVSLAGVPTRPPSQI